MDFNGSNGYEIGSTPDVLNYIPPILRREFPAETFKKIERHSELQHHSKKQPKSMHPEGGEEDDIFIKTTAKNQSELANPKMSSNHCVLRELSVSDYYNRETPVKSVEKSQAVPTVDKENIEHSVDMQDDLYNYFVKLSGEFEYNQTIDENSKDLLKFA